MSDFNGLQNNPNRPKLKKVKRPVNKVNPVQNNQVPNKAVTPNLPTRTEEKSYIRPAEDIFSLDEYLDRDDDRKSRFVSDDDLIDNRKGNFFKVGNLFTLNGVLVIAFCGLLLGGIFTKLFFSSEKIVQGGLQGVVINDEVSRGRARCGIAERTQGCVLYIMNPQKEELNARDFYDLAAQLTGRQRFVIETGNIRYSNKKIKPGEIAQFNIPPL